MQDLLPMDSRTSERPRLRWMNSIDTDFKTIRVWNWQQGEHSGHFCHLDTTSPTYKIVYLWIAELVEHQDFAEWTPLVLISLQHHEKLLYREIKFLVKILKNLIIDGNYNNIFNIPYLR
ncbi:hypothetical protein TNIN_372501 [Trichonephila inaurata madagascariensis]|uniref:Uncharacterized protein n=1 Tax=Trichonephila inaurata madagascariensis TaxID=2747483 RepID=A0A8X6WVW1_9ARAC|nr:hypothetical protein TNIN_372501 [Trichonephila inaurata madagascariensis]